jgi:hypothetical protein
MGQKSSRGARLPQIFARALPDFSRRDRGRSNWPRCEWIEAICCFLAHFSVFLNQQSRTYELKRYG